MIEIKLTQGFDVTIAIQLVDQFFKKENLSAADKATFSIRRSTSEAALLTKSTGGSGCVINASEASLEVTLTTAELSALLVGSYVAASAVRFGSETAWYSTDEITLVILPKIAEKV